MEIQTSERMLTKLDHVRLTRMAARLEPGASQSVQSLLDDSYLVPSPAIPASVITMYTQVLLQGEPPSAPFKVTLCYPADAEPARGFISVLSPLGASLLGLEVGDIARWRTPVGEDRTARVLQVLFQPEASGDYTT
ncbi:transcription elongation factor GreAB [Ramlibacter henchirensis]|uniref:Transcription elongation factor GreAB n=1 Tax=Ramlibacter henchirensis TaxID=204072 RepID=A0A4Z0C212_9BURK|nr:GreA/GreB family elongation factor [Ramlibacter henchirensis]TFZ05687.1 transcription elongation factor GreAB [Ramlibacter henchirensis]